MATLADLFKTCYLTSGNGIEFADIRLHYRGVDEICRAFGASALTIGSDIYFRREAFAPHRSIKRVASAAGEGATAIHLVHEYLRAEQD
jgi:hypothetical protein